MPIVKHMADSLRRKKPRVNAKLLKATTEAGIARQAAEDHSSTEGEDFSRWRKVLPLDVAAIRAKTGLSQMRFARTFQISPHTLRNWEQGRRVPDGPARVLLTAIDRDPKAIMRVLMESSLGKGEAGKALRRSG